MTFWEKLYSIFAVFFIAAVFFVLIFYPQTRDLKLLVPISFVGIVVNIVFMFIVLRDILIRDFQTSGQRYLWTILVLFFWPVVLVYLPKHGFRARNG